MEWLLKTHIGRLALSAIWCVIFGTLTENVDDNFIYPFYVGVLYICGFFLFMVFHAIKNGISSLKNKNKK